MSVSLGRHGNGPLRMVRVGIYRFWCPGCQAPHNFNISSTDRADGRFWGWDGDFEKPTVEPEVEAPGCRVRLHAGVLVFSNDCTHQLRGQAVPLPNFPM